AQDAGAVHEEVELAELLDRAIDERLAASDRRYIRWISDGASTRGFDLADHIVGWHRGFLFAIDRHAEVIDHNRRALRRQCFRDCTTDSSPASSHRCYLAIEFAHDVSPV